MTLMLPGEFLQNPQCNLSNFQGPAGDAMLYDILDQATTLVGDYIDMDLRYHAVWDETEAALSPTLPVFPKQWPPRAILAYQVMAWAQEGRRQTWNIPSNALEQTIGGAPPILFGNVEVNRVSNMFQALSYAGALGFPWSAVFGMGGEVHVSYTAGFDDPSPSVRQIAWTDVVNGPTAAHPTTPMPSATQFALSPGFGALPWTNATIRVSGQSGTVLAVSGDVVTLAAPLTSVPNVGDLVEQDDPVTMPAPRWLKNYIRMTARFLVELTNATYGGAAGVGTIQWGQVKWSLPASVQPDLPQSVKDALNQRFAATTAELA